MYKAALMATLERKGELSKLNMPNPGHLEYSFLIQSILVHLS